MTEGTIWFDTGACRNSPASLGKGNRSIFVPATERFQYTGESVTLTNTETGEEVTRPAYAPVDNGVWALAAEATVQYTYDEAGNRQYEPNLSPAYPIFRVGTDSALAVTPDSQMKVYDEELFKRSINWAMDFYDECDIDCQQKGSQATLVATLSAIPYGLVGLNSLFMILGAWVKNCRICSIWCTLFACLVQFAVLCVTATMLFSHYSLGCFGALTPTAGEGVQWTMSDEMWSMAYLYITGWFSLFVFLCCGWCQVYHPETKK